MMGTRNPKELKRAGVQIREERGELRVTQRHPSEGELLCSLLSPWASNLPLFQVYICTYTGILTNASITALSAWLPTIPVMCTSPSLRLPESALLWAGPGLCLHLLLYPRLTLRPYFPHTLDSTLCLYQESLPFQTKITQHLST